MGKYIPLDALVAEIEKIKEGLQRNGNPNPLGNLQECLAAAEIEALNLIKDSLDTLEVKEIDLKDDKKEELAQKYIDYTFKRHNIDANSREGQLIYYAYMHGMNQCLTQLKAQKGE